MPGLFLGQYLKRRLSHFHRILNAYLGGTIRELFRESGAVRGTERANRFQRNRPREDRCFQLPKVGHSEAYMNLCSGCLWPLFLPHGSKYLVDCDPPTKRGTVWVCSKTVNPKRAESIEIVSIFYVRSGLASLFRLRCHCLSGEQFFYHNVANPPLLGSIRFSHL